MRGSGWSTMVFIRKKKLKLHERGINEYILCIHGREDSPVPYLPSASLLALACNAIFLSRSVANAMKKKSDNHIHRWGVIFRTIDGNGWSVGGGVGGRGTNTEGEKIIMGGKRTRTNNVRAIRTVKEKGERE